MNTRENNKLIAEFMEYPSNGFSKYVCPVKDIPVEADELPYHTSWDWLMPVVEKVNLLTRHNEKVTEYFTSELGSCDYMKYMLGDVVVTSGITDVFPEVVEFIKWYNENK